MEDDYFFVPEAGKIIGDALETLPFITPYDHPDYYSNPIHKYERRVRFVGNHHWQNVISTTLTFACQSDALKKEIDTIKSYGWADHPMWTDITQRTSLYAPIPTLASHLEIPYLSPKFTEFENLN